MKSLSQLCLSMLVVIGMAGFTASAQSNDAVPLSAISAAQGVLDQGMNKAPMGAAETQWTTGSPLPGAKCYHSATYLNGAIYVFGGLGATLRFDATCYKFDVATSTWSTIKPLPVQRGLPVVQTVGDKIYIIGGYSATSPFTVQNPVLEYDPATDTYTQKASMITGVFGAGSFVYEGRIFVLGGGTTAFATCIDAIQIYDPALDQWTISGSKTPFASWATGVTLIGNTALYVGGVRYVSGSGTFGAWSYKGAVAGSDIIWTQISDYPDGSIMRHSAGTDGTKAYFTGGYRQESMNNGPPSGMTYSYEPVSGVWEMKDIKPLGIFFATQMIFDGTDKLYVFGGNDGPSTVTAAVEIFDVTAEGGPVAMFKETDFDIWLKAGNTTKLNIDLTNNGSAALSWNASISSPSAWMTLNASAGSVQPGINSPIPVSISSVAGIGTHVGTVTVTTNDPLKPSIDLTITLHVQAEDVDADVNVVLEEGTGTWCGFCPYGADSLQMLVDQYPGRVFGISYHGGSATEPMFTPHTDFWTNLVGLTGWPNGSINRIVFPGESKPALSRPVWGDKVREVMQTRRSPISINIQDKSYNAATKEMELTIEVFFHRGFNKPLRLNIAQLQDEMNYTQSFYPASGGSTKLYPYFHNHVLRQMIPNDQGEMISTGSAIASQSRITKTFTFISLDSTVETSRFVIFAHISDGVTFGDIVQAEELTLSSFVTDVQPLPENAAFMLHQNYPNPFNPSTTVSFDVPSQSQVSVIVTDALGRILTQLADGTFDRGRHTLNYDASGLPSGTYFLTMRAGAFTQTRTLTLMK
ncbi:MAG: Omp28-related outer membrane protein [Bacteroidota bacterium]